MALYSDHLIYIANVIREQKLHSIIASLRSVPPPPPSLRDWSLIMGRGGGGGLQSRSGASFTSMKRGGGSENVLAILKGVQDKFRGSL